MVEYYIDTINGGLVLEKKGTGEYFPVSVLTIEEFHNGGKLLPHYKEMLHSLGSIRYSRAEQDRSCIQGILRIPQKNERRTSHLAFGFYLMADRLVLIEDSGNLKEILEKSRDRMAAVTTPDRLLLAMLEQETENDILYLSHLEEKMYEMEEKLLKNDAERFYETLLQYRRKLAEFSACYRQLADVGEVMHAEGCSNIVKNHDAWEYHTGRMVRLENYVSFLHEYAMQLRELYQYQQDARQNKIMGILTVVTTLFLPLTLLTGWYGMNFEHMPELTWKYGYAGAAAAALLILIAEIVYFKKKHLL